MHRIAPLSLTTAPADARPTLLDLQTRFGRVPNVYATAAHAPAALAGLLAFKKSLEGGSFDAKTREAVALAVSQANGCDYCVAAHSAVGRLSGLSNEDVAAARRGTADDPARARVVSLAAAMTATRGDVAGATLDAFHAAGGTDAEIVEVIAHVAANVFTNYLNHVAGTEIDFPPAT